MNTVVPALWLLDIRIVGKWVRSAGSHCEFTSECVVVVIMHGYSNVKKLMVAASPPGAAMVATVPIATVGVEPS